MSAGRRLVRALTTSARRAGCAIAVTDVLEQPWSSATFVGTQHAIALEPVTGSALAKWLDGLAEAEMTVPGHVVAELAVERGRGGTMLRVLTLEV